MKKTLTTLMAAGALGLGVQQAEAAFVNGAIAISAPVKPNNNNLMLATLLDIDEVNAFVQPGTAQGDFIGATAVTFFATGLTVNPVAGLPTLIYSLNNGISFILTILTEVSNNASSLVLEGTGVFTAPGKDPTFGDFDISVIRSISGGGRFITFNMATTSAVDGGTGEVPDGGITAMLLGLGFIGLSSIRRKVS